MRVLYQFGEDESTRGVLELFCNQMLTIGEMKKQLVWCGIKVMPGTLYRIYFLPLGAPFVSAMVDNRPQELESVPPVIPAASFFPPIADTVTNIGMLCTNVIVDVTMFEETKRAVLPQLNSDNPSWIVHWLIKELLLLTLPSSPIPTPPQRR
eukprot:m51a1_g4613 hypothetical protein (152) ;mRNA; r:269108-269695